MTDFVTVGVYQDIANAHIALGRLEAEGIPAILKDAHFVQTDWLYAIALGGIKLQVEASLESNARRVLETDYSGDIDEDADTGGEPEQPRPDDHGDSG